MNEHNKRLLHLLFATLFLIVFTRVYGQDKNPSFITDSLDSYVETALDQWKIPGVAVLVVKDGKVVVMKGYGVKEEGKRDMVDEHTLFMIGSNTKAFTGISLAMLAASGRCTLEDKVIKWVPNYTMVDPWVKENATLSDVVSHRIGMQTFQGDFMIFDSDFTSEEIIKRVGSLEPEHEFRTTWGYYNTGFLIAGEAIESISGLSWADFVRNNIFIPLEMDESLALTEEMPKASNRASAHSIVEDKVAVIDYGMIDAIAPAGSISSSVYDMSHWVLTLLADGMYKDSEVIPSTAINMTIQPKSILGRGGHPFNRQHFNLYGMGWFLKDYEGYEIVAHTGGIHGFVTAVTLVPEKNLGIVVLTNTDKNAFYQALQWEIVDAYLELPYRNYSKVYNGYVAGQEANTKNQIQQWRDSAALQIKTPIPLNQYTGEYEHEIYGTIQVKAKDEGLEMTFEHHPDLSAELNHLSNNRFLCTFNNPLFGINTMSFEREGDKISALNFKVADFIEQGEYHFDHLDN